MVVHIIIEKCQNNSPKKPDNSSVILVQRKCGILDLEKHGHSLELKDKANSLKDVVLESVQV